MVRFFAWLLKLIFGRKTTSASAPTEPKTAPVAPLRQDDRDKSIVIRIDDDESTDDEADEVVEPAEVVVLEKHADEEFPVPTFTAHHHHF